MTKIKDLLQKAGSTLAGNEEFVINDPAGDLDRKVTATQIVQGVVDDLTTEINATNSDIAALTSDKVSKAGDTMTGTLTLAGAPTANLHASTKKYVDDADILKADLASPTFTGTPAAPTATDGTNTTQIATTAFVINQIDEYVFERTAVTSSPHNATEDEAGILDVNVAGAVTINLPLISSLTFPAKTFYRIVDSGYNANTTTQIISIKRAGADTIGNGAISETITVAGESVYLYNDGVSAWYIANKKTAASETEVGVTEYSTDAEALARTATDKALTPANLDHVIKNTLNKTNTLGAASKVMTAADAGSWWVSYTSTGPVAITLPDPSTIDKDQVFFEITDAGDPGASTNPIDITSAAGTINGTSSYTISNTRTGAYFVSIDGVNWETKADSAKAAETAAAASAIWSSGAGTDIYYSGDAALGDSSSPNSLLHLEKTTGDPAITMAIGGADKFIFGLDDSDSDNLKLSRGSAIGTNDVFEVDSTTGSIGFGTSSDTGNYDYIFQGFGATEVAEFRDSGGTRSMTISEDGTVRVWAAGLNTFTVGGSEFSDSFMSFNTNTEIATMTAKNGYAGGASIVFDMDIAISKATDNTALRLSASNAGAGDAYAMDIVDGDIKLDTTTGTKIGTAAGQKLAFYGATPIIQPATITQTYALSSLIHSARTAPTAGGGTGADATTFSGAQCDALVADQQNTAQVLNDVINKLKNLGLLA
jgi:hypothetical protein